MELLDCAGWCGIFSVSWLRTLLFEVFLDVFADLCQKRYTMDCSMEMDVASHGVFLLVPSDQAASRAVWNFESVAVVVQEEII